MSLNEKQQTFVNAFCEALDANVVYAEAFRTAKVFAGYAENTSKRDVLTDEMLQEIQAHYNRDMVVRLAKASKELEGLLDEPNQDGATVLLATVNSVLDRGGLIKKESKEITIKAPTGIVSMPPKGELDPVE